jgi:perosamine synthetase
MKIPLIKPFIDQRIKEKVLEVLDSGYLTEGTVTHEFEHAFREYVGSKNAIAVTSCTTGLEIALRSLNIGPGDEVIVPDFTYPATATVVTIVGANCVIVDIDPDTMLIDYDAIENAITSRTKAIIPVSLFGNPLDYDRLSEIKQKYGVHIVEDAACALGAQYRDKRVGIFADITVFSLHPRKFITTGEGGMITTDNQAWADWMNSYKHFGMALNTDARERIIFEISGTNYKLSNVLSAIGLGQLQNIEILLKKRRKLASAYDLLLSKVNGIDIPKTTIDGLHSYQSYCIFTNSRDRILNNMRHEGVEVQIGTYSLHLHPAFQDKEKYSLKGDLSGSSKAYNSCLVLPLFHDLSEVEQEYIVDRIKELI